MPTITAAATPDECAAWLTENLPEAYAATASAAALEHGFDGAALFKLSEDDLSSKLGIVKFGTKRKLSLLLKETERATAGAPQAGDSSAASSSASAAGRGVEASGHGATRTEHASRVAATLGLCERHLELGQYHLYTHMHMRMHMCMHMSHVHAHAHAHAHVM